MRIIIGAAILAFFLSLEGCTAQLYVPDISTISAGPHTGLVLPNNEDIWLYAANFIATFGKRVDLDAGVDFGGNVGDVLLSGAAAGVAMSGAGGAVVGYMAGAEGMLRRLLGIANPVVRGNALSGGIRSIRSCRAQFLVDVVAEAGADHTPLSSAGLKGFQCIEASVNMVIAALQGSWPTLPEILQSTSQIVVSSPTGSGITLVPTLPTPKVAPITR